MTDVQTFEGKCEICGEPFAPATTEAQFARNKGLHLRLRHKIKGKHSVRNKRFRLQQKTEKIETPAPEPKLSAKERDRARKREWYRKHKGKGTRTYTKRTPAAATPDVRPILLDHCPHCNSRFYISTPQ